LGLRFRDRSEPQQYKRRAFAQAPDPELDDKLNWSLAELELSARTCSALEATGLIAVRQIIARNATELLELPGVDAVVVAELSARLAERVLRLGMCSILGRPRAHREYTRKSPGEW
jgi:DNA-directed RNA polymerase alpha subunit